MKSKRSTASLIPSAYAPLVESLPKNLRGSLPSVADIERELNKPRREAVWKKPKP